MEEQEAECQEFILNYQELHESLFPLDYNLFAKPQQHDCALSDIDSNECFQIRQQFALIELIYQPQCVTVGKFTSPKI